MISIEEAVVWVNDETREVIVRPHAWGVPEDRKGYRRGDWCDPIGAAYSEWRSATDAQRVRLMLETVIDLAMQGVPRARDSQGVRDGRRVPRARRPKLPDVPRSDIRAGRAMPRA
jgi:hypothetical protein